MHRPLPLSAIRPTRAALACAAALALAACAEPNQPVAPEASAHGAHGSATARRVSGDVARQVAGLRALTARFHDFDTAEEAGWGAQITGCMSDPQLGGMGFHYGNPALIDGQVDVLEPELLVYEPRKNGKLRLVAVEYIVPFTAWTAAEPPQLYGQSFHRNEAFGIWALHVWHFRNNPRGLFADWNPNVTCRYAAP